MARWLVPLSCISLRRREDKFRTSVTPRKRLSKSRMPSAKRAQAAESKRSQRRDRSHSMTLPDVRDHDPWADQELTQLSADDAYLSCEYA